MKKSTIIILIAAIAALLAAAFWYLRPPEAGAPIAEARNLDTFAQCLADKNVVMYGAAWCAHCKNEKNAFGDSFGYVPYVECPDAPQVCIEKGIEGYPTWIFPDGRKLVGEQGLEKLSRESNCALP